MNRIFVTGATGYLGGAVAARLQRSGRTVYGLTRDSKRAEALAAAGITPVVGSLEQPASWIATLKNCDAAVHAAIDPHATAGADQAALESFRVAALDGRLRRLIYTSALWVNGDTAGHMVDETTPLDPLEYSRWRAAHEEVALDLIEQEVEVVIFRPGILYGESRGIIGAMFAEARDHGTVTFPGDGSQRWSMVHRDDVADAYALGLEHSKGDERYLLVDGAVQSAREVAEAIASATGATARSWNAAEVVAELGAYGSALLATTGATAAKARRELGWVPRHPSFTLAAKALFGEWEASAGAPVQ